MAQAVLVKPGQDEDWNPVAITIDLKGGGTTKKGDVNGDSTVDVADIANIIDVMAQGTNNPQADVNGDDTVDVADIAAIIDIMAKN
jgi:biopolymer transport protein ExbD